MGGGGGHTMKSGIRSLLEDENLILHLLIAELNFTALVFFAWWTFVLLQSDLFFSSF